MGEGAVDDVPESDSVGRRRAFGLGGDARLAGLPVTANPFGSAEGRLRAAWAEGYCDVHYHWGEEALWPHRRLPPIRPAA